MSTNIATELSRYHLRQTCEVLGYNCGRAGQWVRRVVISVIPGQGLIDHELTFAQGDDVLLHIAPAPAFDRYRSKAYDIASALAAAMMPDQALNVQLALLHAAENDEDTLWVEEVHLLSNTTIIPKAGTTSTTVATRIKSRSDGRLIAAHLPENTQADVTVGDTIITDTVLIRLQAQAATPALALAKLAKLVNETTFSGVLTDQRRIAALCAHPAVIDGSATTAFAALPLPPADVTVLQPGIQTTIQDLPGRIGYWAVGIPPSGPMDDLALRLVNQVVGNAVGCAGLEMTLGGVTLRFDRNAVIALGGAHLNAELAGQPIDWWTPIYVEAGSILRLGGLDGAGARTYLAIRGGFAAPRYLGSRSTFTLGGFGGNAGRELRAGDELTVSDDVVISQPRALSKAQQPRYERTWDIGVLYGPHGAPDFFTPADIREFFAATWSVSPQSNRTGVRLIGPKPRWARSDGGEAGLHPSNIHDNAYALGSVDFTGDMPVILGPDGPSLGGFVCPVVVATAERWKLGQLKAGDHIRFVRLDRATARNQAKKQGRPLPDIDAPEEAAILQRLPATSGRPAVCYRRAGDDNVLVEYGPLELDIALRLRAHALQTVVASWGESAIIDLTAGIRSLQIHFDPARLDETALVDRLVAIEATLPDGDHLTVPSRIVYLPLSWDDPATRKAIDIYMRTVRPDAPWCPSNLEFIRRINGLSCIDEVKRIVFDAEYLVMGLGDVYLGAPVATPVDPRHRLVTTKYNPARTWTPENAVGIGGAYMCVYGMEGPGGYQFVGRTVQVWNAWRTTTEFTSGKPWLLQPFDRIKFYPVSAEELLRLREDFPRGKFSLRIEDGSFSLAAHHKFLHDHAGVIATFTARRQQAFAEERSRWQQGAKP